MASRKIEDLHPKLIQIFNATLARWMRIYPQLPVPSLTCTHRPKSEQNLLYAKGRTTKGNIVTNAKAGESPHNYLPSVAFDIAFKKEDGSLDWNEELFKKFAEIVESLTSYTSWGGSWKSFKDFPHFELKDWKRYINS